VIAAWFWKFEIRPPQRLAGGSVKNAQANSTLGRHPNILLIGVDSLRSDKIDEENTPVIARLCREAVYFPNTLVTLPRTAPSWAALLTSLPPLGNGVETMFPTAARSRLAQVAMPAHLASLGYFTMVASEYAGEFFGRVNLGFEHRAVPRVELEQMLGQALLARQPIALAMAGELYTSSDVLRRWLPGPVPELMRGIASFSHPYVIGADLLQELGAKRPWLAVLFYSQPHFPYTSSSPFYERRTVAGSDPALRFGKDVARGEVKTAADRAQIEALYRGALAETDSALGDLLDYLQSAGELDDTIVILTADHGEGLYDCPGCVGHGDNLHGMATLTVPLAFRLPRRRFEGAVARKVEGYVSQLDVYPTVLNLLQVDRLATQEGVALLTPHGRPVNLPADRTFFAETGEWLWPTSAVPADRITYPPITGLASLEEGRIVIDERYLPVIRAAKHRTALLPPFKMVYRPGREAAHWSLYDIVHDPLEEHDISASRPLVEQQLRSALVHSVLRFSHMVPSGDYFLTRPPAPLEEYY